MKEEEIRRVRGKKGGSKYSDDYGYSDYEYSDYAYGNYGYEDYGDYGYGEE